MVLFYGYKFSNIGISKILKLLIHVVLFYRYRVLKWVCKENACFFIYMVLFHGYKFSNIGISKILK